MRQQGHIGNASNINDGAIHLSEAKHILMKGGYKWRTLSVKSYIFAAKISDGGNARFNAAMVFGSPICRVKRMRLLWIMTDGLPWLPIALMSLAVSDCFFNK